MPKSSSVVLSEFNPESIGDNRVCLFIGKRGSGKSTGMRALMYYKRNIPSGICMSETEESNKFWQQSIPETYIYTQYDTDATMSLINEQRRQHKHIADKSLHKPVFWIAEDVMGSEELSKCKQARRVFTNGRQWGIFAILAMQYIKDLPPKFRGQVDYVFAYRVLSLEDREKLYKDFFSSAFDTYADFHQVLKQCTSDYNCLVLDATKPTNKLEEMVYWWKAPEVPDFKAGSREYWEFHLMNFRNDDSDGEDDVVLKKHHRRLKVKMVR